MNRFVSYSRCPMWFMALLLGALAAGCGGDGGRDPILGIGPFPPPPVLTDTTRPTVTFTVPADGDVGVSTITKITATFSEAMAPATINTTSFTLRNDTTATAVVGTVTYDVDSRTAIFTPTVPATLPATNSFTATITAAATDLSGNTLTAGPVPNPWSFDTGAGPDAVPPTVTLRNPPDLATGVCRQQNVNATFDEDMDPSTITTATFTLQVTAGPGPVLGAAVTYDPQSRVATLNPTNDLLANTNYTATVTTGAEDLAGNGLAANEVWTFTTGTQACLSPVALGAAASFGGFGGGAGMTNQGTFTVINGDIGTTGASTTMTGFHDTQGDIYTETPANIGTVNGTIFTCPPPPGGAGQGGTADTCFIANEAAADAQTAFDTLAGLTGGCAPPCAANLGGVTLLPGVYTAPLGSFLIQGGNLTLDAQGDANAVWVFQMATTLRVGGPGTAFPQSVLLTNGAQAKNVFWQVGSGATINAAGGGTMVGTIISSAATTFSTAGNVTIVTLNGRALALNASVTMVNTVINVPAP